MNGDPGQAAAALAAAQLPGSIAAAVARTGVSPFRVKNARLVLHYAPDLAGPVTTGRRTLHQAAQLARLRRDAPDIAARIEPHLTGDPADDVIRLDTARAQAAGRKAAAR